jgi:hypothetical protein
MFAVATSMLKRQRIKDGPVSAFVTPTRRRANIDGDAAGPSPARVTNGAYLQIDARESRDRRKFVCHVSHKMNWRRPGEQY